MGNGDACKVWIARGKNVSLWGCIVGMGFSVLWQHGTGVGSVFVRALNIYAGLAHP